MFALPAPATFTAVGTVLDTFAADGNAFRMPSIAPSSIFFSSGGST